MSKAEHKYPCIDKYAPGSGFVTEQRINQLAKGKLGASGKLKAAFKVAALWDPKKYPVLNIGFMDGTPKQKAWVEKVVTENLQPLVNNIQFKWNTPLKDSQIRISFKLQGQAWSLLGNEALKIPQNEATMNLGWLDNDDDYDVIEYKNTGVVIMHEFGHAMGMIHEHQNPKENPIVWNEDVVYRELKRTNGWDKEQINTNMFQKYGSYNLCEQAKKDKSPSAADYCKGQLVNGSVYDPKSVMHYIFAKSWIKSGPEIPVNKTYSDMDKDWIKKYYSASSIVEKFTMEYCFMTQFIVLVILFGILYVIHKN